MCLRARLFFLRPGGICNMDSGIVHDDAYDVYGDDGNYECPTDPDIAGLGVGSMTVLDDSFAAV